MVKVLRWFGQELKRVWDLDHFECFFNVQKSFDHLNLDGSGRASSQAVIQRLFTQCLTRPGPVLSRENMMVRKAARSTALPGLWSLSRERGRNLSDRVLMIITKEISAMKERKIEQTDKDPLKSQGKLPDTGDAIGRSIHWWVEWVSSFETEGTAQLRAL